MASRPHPEWDSVVTSRRDFAHLPSARRSGKPPVTTRARGVVRAIAEPPRARRDLKSGSARQNDSIEPRESRSPGDRGMEKNALSGVHTCRRSGARRADQITESGPYTALHTRLCTLHCGLGRQGGARERRRAAISRLNRRPAGPWSLSVAPGNDPVHDPIDTRPHAAPYPAPKGLRARSHSGPPGRVPSASPPDPPPGSWCCLACRLAHLSRRATPVARPPMESLSSAKGDQA